MVYGYGMMGSGMMGYTGGIFGLFLWLLLLGLVALVWLWVFKIWNDNSKKKR